MSNSSASGGGIGLAGMVFIVFLILKLAEIGTVATWSWWWVTSPLWIPFCAVVGICIVFFALALLIAGIGACCKKKN